MKKVYQVETLAEGSIVGMREIKGLRKAHRHALERARHLVAEYASDLLVPSPGTPAPKLHFRILNPANEIEEEFLVDVRKPAEEAVEALLKKHGLSREFFGIFRNIPDHLRGWLTMYVVVRKKVSINLEECVKG